MIDEEPDEVNAAVPKSRNEHGGVSLHIERLILDGVRLGPGQAAQLQASLEQELTQLITTNGLGSGMIAGGAVPSFRTRGIQLSKVLNPQRLGSQIAQAVYSGLTT